ncbi:hypothetical protein Cantr_04003 [Candida viswanathii]|uniref:Wbp11/ELF5/Saf1 N-terminal domain-containing protein n=1 Tax=Candida viswanathii TaxID=5486 RepID=A0A367XQP5_9ASCO|nr:hypothetical protein Cantr_04003 [Candida viswanathii]
MIRGSWNLADEFKKNERKQVSKIQQRQKHQHKLEKLSKTDPIRLYYRIERLEQQQDKSDKDNEYLQSLKDDWSFIEKNNLHSSKLKPFLQEKQKKEKEKLKQQSKLWGLKSVYFNPELNPLGKVPDVDNLSQKPSQPLQNLTLPLKTTLVKYEPDPLIKELRITCPSGEPPRFYKLIQNTSKSKPKKREEGKEEPEEVLPNTADPLKSSDEEDEANSSEDAQPSVKRIKLS